MGQRDLLHYLHSEWTCLGKQRDDRGIAARAPYRYAEVTSFLLPEHARCMAQLQQYLRSRGDHCAYQSVALPEGRAFLSFAVVDVNPSMTSSRISSMIKLCLDGKRSQAAQEACAPRPERSSISRPHLAPGINLPVRHHSQPLHLAAGHI